MLNVPSFVQTIRGFTCWITGALLLLAFGAPASADFAGDKPAWIRNARDQMLNNFPAIDAFMWFNLNKERDWRVNSTPESLTAYQEDWGGLEHGVYLDGFPYPPPPDTTLINGFETMVGHHQARVGWYESLDMPFPTAAVDAVLARGSKPYIVWEPFDGSVPGETARSGEGRLDDILRGDYDARIDAWAQAAKLAPGQIEITFGHEMNGNWFTWGYLGGHNGNSPTDFVNAFQYVVNKFGQAGVTNVDWVWTINASWEDDYTVSFPGEDYVDRMGMNGFNWGDDPDVSGPDWAKWREFENIFGSWILDEWGTLGVNNYEALVELADLPIIIAEFASTPEPTTLVLLSVGGLLVIRGRRRQG